MNIDEELGLWWIFALIFITPKIPWLDFFIYYRKLRKSIVLLFQFPFKRRKYSK